VDEGGADDRVFALFSREWDRSFDRRTRSERGVDDRLRTLIDDLVIVRPNLDAEPRVRLFLWGGRGDDWSIGHRRGERVEISRYLVILVTAPAPTVWPPSRIAKRCFSSRATGLISLTFNFI